MDPRFMICKPIPRRWLRQTLALALALGFASALAATPAKTHPISLWKVTGPAGHTLYLAGSMHALTQADLPLPQAYTRAFEDSDKLVEELNLKTLDPQQVTNQALAMGVMKDQTLAQAMGKKDWARVQELADKAGVTLYHYEHFKPWLAAIGIADTLLVRLGYQPQLGLDMHFADLAGKRNMPASGLETIAEQLSFFNDMKPEVQRRFLLQTLSEAESAKKDLARLHAAWANGDVQTLETLQRDNFKGFAHVRKRLIADRNARWLPHLEKCLGSGKTCFVVVGVEHMVGPHGLIALMKSHGARVVQLDTPVRAPEPASAAH